MGIFDSFFGGTKDQTTTTNTVTGPNTPTWFKSGQDKLTQTGLSQLEQLAGTTADQRIMGFNPDELAAQERIRSGVGRYDDIIGNAMNMLQQAQQKSFEGVNPDDIQKFLNPYRQNVIDISKDQAVRDADIARNKIQANAAAAGAFGGGRSAIENANLNDSLTRNLSNLEYTGLSDAWDKAIAAARQSTADTINAGSAIGGLANTGTNIYNADTQALAASGEAQRGLEQAKTDFTYTNPYNTTTQGASLLNQMSPLYGTNTNTTQTSPVQYAGWGSQLLGAATAIGSLGTGGGGTIAGSLLSKWLGGSGGSAGPGMNTGSSYATDNPVGAANILQAMGGRGISSGTPTFADGGAVPMAEGGEPLSAMLKMLGASNASGGSDTLVYKNLSPTEKAVMEDTLKDEPYIPGTKIPFTLPEGVLMPPEVISNGKPKTTLTLQEPELSLPEEQFTTTSPTDRPVIESAAAAPAPIANAGVAALADKPVEKSRLQKMLDDTNLPLLKMGLTMMASDKPFFEALGAGGLAGAAQIDKEREAAAKSAEEAKKLAVEKEKNQITEAYNKGRIDAANEKNRQSALKIPAEIMAKTSYAKRMNQTNLTIKNQLDSIDKEYGNLSRQFSASFDANEKKAIKAQMDANRQERTNLVKGLVSSSRQDAATDLQDETNKAIEKQLNWNDLPD